MRIDGIKIALCIGLSVSVAINVLQGTRLLRLADAGKEQTGQGELRPGMIRPNLELKDLSGRRVMIDFGSTEKSTVLYVFTPSCAWCARNSQNLAALAKQIPGSYRLVGLSLSGSGLGSFVKAHGISFPVYQDPSPDVIATYHLGPTPETLVIAPGGRLSVTWTGAFLGPTRSLVERFFSIRLPDPES